MNVIRLAFPTLHLLTRSYTTTGRRIEGGTVEDLVATTRGLGLGDRSWRDARGPRPAVGETRWLRGDLGGIVCVVTRPEGMTMHVLARDGEPVAIVRNMTRERDRLGADV